MYGYRKAEDNVQPIIKYLISDFDNSMLMAQFIFSRIYIFNLYPFCNDLFGE